MPERYSPAARILKMTVALASSAEGLTIDEMVEQAGVGRRSISRLKNAIEELLGPLQEERVGTQKRFRIANRIMSPFFFPNSRELAEIETAAAFLQHIGHEWRARQLRSISQKVFAAMSVQERSRLAPDVEGLRQAVWFVSAPGPRSTVPGAVLDQVAEAILRGVQIRFSYGPAREPRQVAPRGLLVGMRAFLVGEQIGRNDPVLWRLDRIADLALTDNAIPKSDTFSLQDYAARAFGVWQETPQDIVLRFIPSLAEAVDNFSFHPSQEVSSGNDGSRIVRFRSGGLLQIAHHLVTWGKGVTIVAPDELRTVMRHVIDEAAEGLAARQA